MTREEAIAVLEESKRQNAVMRDNPSTFWASHQMTDGVKNAERRIAALELVLTALRPFSREQVEIVWRGYWIHEEIQSNQSTTGYFKISSCECSKCGCYIQQEANFCPSCGATMTDEAVQMVMERMEALKDD